MTWKRRLIGCIPAPLLRVAHVCYWIKHKQRFVAMAGTDCHDLGIPFGEAYSRRREFYRYIHDNFIGGQAITYLEFGVYRGESLGYWAELNGHEGSRFYGFDTFEGLPEEWKSHPAGHLSAAGEVPHSDDTRVRFVKGLFQDTLDGVIEKLDDDTLLIVHIDSDLYSSALYILTRLDPRLVPGTLLLFDQWGRDDEYRAFADYIKAYRKRLVPVATMNASFDKTAFRVDSGTYVAAKL